MSATFTLPLDRGHEAYALADLVNYLLWLGKTDPGGWITYRQITAFVEGYIQKGRYPSEVAFELDLPEGYPEWDDEEDGEAEP